MTTSKPLISLIIPTIGRKTLARLLSSVPVDNALEVLVIGDSFQDDFTKDILESADVLTATNCHWHLYDSGLHSYGHPQRNYGMTLAQGHWLMFSQDDNVFNAGVFPFIVQTLCQHPLQPVLFKVDTWQAGIVWRDAGRITEGNFDADCLVVPNIKEKLGVWANRYNGDADMIIETASKWDNDLAWIDKIIAVARPESA